MRKLVCILMTVCATFGFALNAQDDGSSKPLTPEEQAKKFQEYIDNLTTKYEENLKLEYWQVYYVDSILNHDMKAKEAELKDLKDSKVSNQDLYVAVSDRWNEQIYNSFHKVFNDEQWKKYLKSGAAREKKARDKRAGKRSE